MSDQRCKDFDWSVRKAGTPNASYEGAQLAVLLDIRDELQRLNRTLHCVNFLEIPWTLREIRRNTTKKKRKKST